MNRVNSRHSLWRRRYNAFAKSNDGATAVEFALIALPFFIMIFGLIEIAILFLFSTTLDHGMAEAARRIPTGELQTQGEIDASDFKEMVCGNLFGLMDCDDKLSVDVRVFASFHESDDGAPEPQDEDDEFDDTTLTLAMGSANDIVMVRVFYEYTLFTPVMSASLTNMPDGRHLMTSSMVFRNEPF